MNRFALTLMTAGLMGGVLCASPAAAQDSQDAAPEGLAAADLTGSTITLDVEDLDIRTLLKLLAHSRQISIIAGEEVAGMVSISFFEVPFEEALDAILGIGGYTHFRKGNIVYVTTEAAKRTMPVEVQDLEYRIYNIQHADLEGFADAITEFLSPGGSAVVKGNMLVVEDAPAYVAQIDLLMETLDAPPFQSQVFEISHADPQELLVTVEQFASPSGTVTVSSENKLVVQDAPEYLERIDALIAKLDLPPRQVLISARILNVTHGDDLSLGVEFESSPIIQPRSAALDTTLPLITDLRADVETLTTGQAGIFSMIIRDNEHGFLEALSTKSKVETLAAPQLLTVDGQMAKIQVGERLGFRVTTTTQTSSLESIEFLDVGTLLEVTPKITKEGLIEMDIHPEVSTGAINASGLPEEKTTEATTVMVVRDGESALIGGLLNITRQRTRSQVPILGNIPVLGHLFGKRTWQDNTSELMILITPHIVKPGEPVPIMEKQQYRVEQYEKSLSESKSELENLGEGLSRKKSKKQGRKRRSKGDEAVEAVEK
jgi:type IV pilus assembly protein PilQ